jgi:hypothetical protein
VNNLVRFKGMPRKLVRSKHVSESLFFLSKLSKATAPMYLWLSIIPEEGTIIIA